MRFELDRLPSDPVLLQRILREMAEVLERERAALNAAKAVVTTQGLTIEKLEHRLARLLRVQFGRSSEQMDIAQLRLMREEKKPALRAMRTGKRVATSHAPAARVKSTSGAARRPDAASTRLPSALTVKSLFQHRVTDVVRKRPNQLCHFRALKRALNGRVRIPGSSRASFQDDGDHRSDMMAISIPTSSRSAFRDERDQMRVVLAV